MEIGFDPLRSNLIYLQVDTEKSFADVWLNPKVWTILTKIKQKKVKILFIVEKDGWIRTANWLDVG